MNHPIYKLLQRLENSGIHYVLSRSRDETIRVTILLIGQRVEVDVFEDGHMEASRFLGTEDVLGGEELVYQLINREELLDKVYDEKNVDSSDPK